MFVKINTARWVEDADNPVNSWIQSPSNPITLTNANTNTGWKRENSGDRTLVIREKGTYEVKPVTLSAAYSASPTLPEERVNASGLRVGNNGNVIYFDKNSMPVEKAAAGTVVYTETLVNTVESDPVLALAPTTDFELSQGLAQLFAEGVDKNGDAVIYFQRDFDHDPDFMDKANWNYAGSWVPNYQMVDGAYVENTIGMKAVVRTAGGTGRTSALVKEAGRRKPEAAAYAAPARRRDGGELPAEPGPLRRRRRRHR